MTDTQDFLEELLAQEADVAEPAAPADAPGPVKPPPPPPPKVALPVPKLKKAEVLAALEECRERPGCARHFARLPPSTLKAMKVASLRLLLQEMYTLGGGAAADSPVYVAPEPAAPADAPKRRRRAKAPIEPEDFVLDNDPNPEEEPKPRQIPLDSAKVSEFMTIATIEMSRGVESLVAAYKPGGKCIDGYADKVAANRAELTKIMAEILESEDAPEFLKNISPTQKLVALLGLSAVASLKDAPPVAAPGTTSTQEQHQWASSSLGPSPTGGS